LGYYAFSIINLEKALAETPGIVLPKVISDDQGVSLIRQQPDVPGVFSISAEELWRWYCAWHNRTARIPLPASLAAAEVISLHLGSIGKVRDSLPPGWTEQAVQRSEQRKIIEVLPLKTAVLPEAEAAYEIDREAATDQRLIVSIPDLMIMLPSEESPVLRLPCHADVLNIEFLVGSEIWQWTPQFRPEFLAFLQHGQVTVQNWMPVYGLSSDEERHREHFEIWIGSLRVQDLQGVPLADWILQWNLLMSQSAELEQKINLLHVQWSFLEEKLSDFAEKTQSVDFFRKYLEDHIEIPFQESQYQELAALLNRRISYRWKKVENQP